MSDDRTPKNNHSHEGEGQTLGDFARRALAAACIGAGVLVMLLLMWYAVDVLLLVFAGIILGVFLRGLCRPLSALLGLGHGWSLLVVLTTLVGALVLVVWLLAGRVLAEANELTEQLPRAVGNLTARLEVYSWGRSIMAELPPTGEFLRGRGSVFGRVSGILSGALGTLAGFIIILSLGCYIAAEPRTYRRGIVHLVPPRYRDRMGEVLDALDVTLGRWLIGRVLLMAVNGALTTLGLWLLGVPLALTLGILAGGLNFVPNIGPLIAGVPAVLLALMVSPQTALYVALLYLVVQSVDGYVFTPLVNRRSVELPPVLTISAQVLLGVLVGGMGVVLAAPLTAMLTVIVRMLYVRRY